MDQIEPGDWVLCRAPGIGWRDNYGVGQVERTTAKTVYAKACYRSQFSFDQVYRMASETEARKLLERIVSAQAEADRRIVRAQRSANDAIAAMLTARQENSNG